MTSFIKQTIQNRTILKKYNFTEEDKNKFEITTLVNFCNDQTLIDKFHKAYNLENKCQTVYTKRSVSKSYSSKNKNKYSYRRTTQRNRKTQKNAKKMQEYILTFIARGNYNSAYTIENRKNRVFRELTSNILTNIEEDEHTKTELNGLFIQWYLSNILCENKICKVFEFGYQQKENEKVNIYAILEKVEDMNAYIEGIQTNFDTELTIILVDILEGLDCIHSNKYVHMDIKLDNIGYIIQNSKIKTKLLDFSTLIKIEGEDGYNIREDIETFTSEYADPLFIHSTIICNLYDIFSFGIILFFIIKKNKNDLVDDKWKNIINKCIFPVSYDDLMDIYNNDSIENPHMEYFNIFNKYLKNYNKNNKENKIKTKLEIFNHISINRHNAKQLIEEMKE